MEQTAPPTLPPFANLAADAVALVAPAVVEIRAGRRVASGVLWRAADGLIVTTARLFRRQRGGPLAAVTGPDAAVEAELVGVDFGTDLAVVRVDPGALDGRADPEWVGTGTLRVGTFVLAASRHGGRIRASFGMVAALGPAWLSPAGGAVDTYLEVDGELRPGASGGPLVDLAARVIGVNTRGLLRQGATLPHATVARVVETLTSEGPTGRGFLGIGVAPAPLPPSVATAAGQPSGLLVTAISRGAVAEQAFLVGDVLLSVDGAAVTDLPTLVAALSGAAGREVILRYVRAGGVEEARVTPAPRPPHGRGHHRRR